MTMPLLTNILTKTSAAIGGTITIVFSKLNQDLFYVKAADACAETTADYPYPAPEKSNTPWNNNWDKREPRLMTASEVLAEPAGSGDSQQQCAPRPTAKRNIFLIRHGQYHKRSGRLTPDGKEQSILTGERLNDLGYPYNTMMYTSSMIRALETASMIRRSNWSLQIKKINSICEGAPCLPEPCLDHPPTREQLQEDSCRIEQAFCRHFHRADARQKEDSYELIVCHSNVIRYFVCRALQFTPDAWMRLSLKNCSITWLVIYPDGRVELKSLGDAEHLPPELRTTS